MKHLPAILKRCAARHFAAAALLAALGPAGAAETTRPPVFHATLRAASEAAAADHSLVLLIFSAEGCEPCRRLKTETLASPEFLQQGEPLHIVEVDADESGKMARAFSVDVIPALVLLTGDGEITARRAGFLNAAEMLAFLDDGRRRADLGQWDGIAPSRPLDAWLKKAAADSLTTNDLQRLVEMLGEPDPADRSGVSAILLAQRELAVPALIDGVTNPGLGVRIGAAELLQRLAPGLPAIDPWQSPDDLALTDASLRKWWVETGALPPPPRARVADPVLQNSINAELENLRGEDPVRRTEAMSALAAHGLEALPAVREAIRRAERSGDQRIIGWLEDVRWAILIPDALEQHAGGARKILAHGKSLDRQSAAERLGKTGAESLAALTELANDPDSLVAECAARALSEVGGDQAIPAMAALLAASDSNLRMTAAQALGHTKNPAAVKPLLTVADDPNEVVACTALAALQEALCSDAESPPNASVPEEIAAVLRQCLSATRWRVRAAAAEAAGKIGANQLAADVKKLLDDPDGFVVQNALAALNRLGAAPDTGELAAIARRLPGLRTGTVEMMLQSKTKETVDAVTDLYNSSDASGQISILQTLAREEGERDAAGWELGISHAVVQNGNAQGTNEETGWKPLLTKAAASADARLRRGAAEALRQQPPKLAASMIAPLLADEDAATRAAAADVVLSILVPQDRGAVIRTSAGAVKTNAPPASAAEMASWHAALLQRTNPAPSLRAAAAVFATGDGKADLPLLLAALDKPETAPVRREQDAAAIGLIISKLPWPEGKNVLDKLCGSPLLFAMAAQAGSRAAAGAEDYLLEPARFKAAVEPAGGEALKGALELLAGYGESDGNSGLSLLWMPGDQVKAVALALAGSTNAAWRAAAVYSLGLRDDADQSKPVFQKALADGNEWVRRMAAQTLARHTADRAALEGLLGPLLSDTNIAVAGMVAKLLLEPEIRQAAGLNDLGYFEFDGSFGGRGENAYQSNDRPLTTLDGKPAFLEAAAKRAATASPEESAVFVLLLAQYGQFEALDRLLARRAGMKAAGQGKLDNAILAGIALSHDARYLPALRQMAAAGSDSSELRKVLQSLQGMSGPDARQLRLDINKKLRTVNNSP